MPKYTVNFHDEDCNIVFSYYADGSPRIQLNCLDGEPMLVATCFLEDAPLPLDCVCIKDYSENEGIEQILIDAGIIEYAGITLGTGYVDVSVCRILVPYKIIGRPS